MDLELEYYLGILDKNEKEFDLGSNKLEKCIFMCNKFIELMDYLKETYDKQFVKNALITLLALFHQNDCSSYYGRDIKHLSALEKEEYFKILRTEFH